VLLPFFNLTWAENYGVSMGMLTASSDFQRWALVALTGLIACAVLIWMFRETAKWDILALSLVLGGALGNIVDRAMHGYVVDFLDLHIGGFRPFLIFNVADACISIGVVILLARALLLRDKSTEASD
jgi:signal peptidase II